MYTKTDLVKVDRARLMELRRLLPHGSIGEIAEELGITRNAVTDVLKGKWINPDVIDRAVLKIEAQKQRVQAIHDKIDRAVKQS
jgi:predicted DNA-binding protein YlxM (UPF0122 family)